MGEEGWVLLLRQEMSLCLWFMAPSPNISSSPRHIPGTQYLWQGERMNEWMNELHPRVWQGEGLAWSHKKNTSKQSQGKKRGQKAKGCRQLTRSYNGNGLKTMTFKLKKSLSPHWSPSRPPQGTQCQVFWVFPQKCSRHNGAPIWIQTPPL